MARKPKETGMETLQRVIQGVDFDSPEEGCCIRHKMRSPEEKTAMLQRLSRIEGQIRGIQGMVERNEYCTDILTQVSAAQAALNGFSRELLGSHIRTCVVQEIQSGNEGIVDELLGIVQKLMK